MSKLTSLQRLDLSKCHKIDSGFQYLTKLTSLRQLDLEFGGISGVITDKGLQYLTESTWIQRSDWLSPY